MKHIKALLLLAVISVLMVGCGSSDKDGFNLFGDSEDDAATSGYKDDPSLGGTEQGINGGLDQGNKSLGPEFSDPDNPLSHQTIYFMYNSSQVQDEFIPVIEAHAQYLTSNPGRRLILEGHADERGSPEYNIALAEQRAKSVLRMMEIQGVQSGQIEVVSYGEEKPAALEQDEAAWQLNRRVEVVYQ